MGVHEAEWIERMRDVPVARVAAVLGCDVRERPSAWDISPCPACGAERRHPSRRDKRGAVGVARSAPAGWRCHACDESGDTLHFVALAKCGAKLGELDRDASRTVREWCQRLLGLDGGAPVYVPSLADAPVPLTLPPEEEIAALWAACVPLPEDDEAYRWLRDVRRLDPDRVFRARLARALPVGVELPAWAGFASSGRSWAEAGYRLIFPVYDASGAMRSLIARRTRTAKRGPHSVAPAGYARGGLVLGCERGLALLRGEGRGASTLVIAEGEMDFIAWATARGAASRACWGIFSGSLTAELLERIPDGTRVLLATDHDEAGEGYAAKALALLHARLEAGRLRAERWQLPEGFGPGQDANDVVAGGGRLEARGEPVGPAPPAPPEGPDEDGPPEIVITTLEHEVTDAAVRAIGSDPGIYQRGGQLVHVLAAQVAGEDTLDPGAPVIAALPSAVLRVRLAAAARWRAVRRGELEAAHPPRWAVDAVHTLGEWPGVRPLTGVVEAPTLRRDGTLLDRPGYDAPTGLLFAPNGGEWPAIPEAPTLEDAQRALAVLDEVIVDFRFAAEHHRSSWLALVLTLLARYAIDGPVPMTLVDAPVAGAGKGLLADVACRIGTGRAMPLDGYPRSDEELDKRLLAWALGARPVVGLDNLSGKLGGDSLCRALTARVVSGRLLGSTSERTAPIRATFVATGNNVELGADMHRRIVHVRLAPLEEDPSTRAGFVHDDLVGYVMARRPALAVAGLTVLRAFVAAGRPVQRLEPWGSYEAWSGLVRAALVWAGRADPAEGRAELRAAADEDRHVHRALVLGWRRLVELERGPLSIRRAIDMVFGEREGELGEAPELADVFQALGRNRRGEVDPRTLGYALRALRGRVFVDDAGRPLMLDCPGRGHNNILTWTVQGALGGGDGGDGGDDPYPHAQARAHAGAHTRGRAHTRANGSGTGGNMAPIALITPSDTEGWPPHARPPNGVPDHDVKRWLHVANQLHRVGYDQLAAGAEARARLWPLGGPGEDDFGPPSAARFEPNGDDGGDS